MHVSALIEFLKGLEENNNKAWFVMNRPSYDILREEFHALVGEVIAKIGRFDAAVRTVESKKAVFRINRDVRFSKDKLPYKTHFGAAISPFGRHGGTPVYYFHIDFNGKLLLAAGCYHPEPDALARIRHAIAANPRPFTRMVEDAAFVKATGGLSTEEALSRAPKGFDPQAEGIEWIRQRNFIVGREFDMTRRIPKDLPNFIANAAEPAFPLVQWLRKTLGEPVAPAAKARARAAKA